MTLVSDLAPVTTMADQLRGALVTDLLGVASYEVKRDALQVASSVAGTDRRLSRFGTRKSRGRPRMNVGYDVTGTQSVVKLRPAALWALSTAGARPHLIGAGRRTRSGKYTKGRRGPRVLVLVGAASSPGRGRPSQVRAAPVRHPGARGRGALKRLHATVPATVSAAFAAGLQSYLDTGKVR